MSEPTTSPNGGDTPPARWPLAFIAAPAAAAVWSGWVGLGEMTGFGEVKPFPGISDVTFNSAITLPIGVEAYGAIALAYALSGRSLSEGTRRFALVSSVVSLVLGAAGQAAYHLLEAEGYDKAPWWITMIVSILPVIVLGAAAALYHMVHTDAQQSRADAGRGARVPAARSAPEDADTGTGPVADADRHAGTDPEPVPTPMPMSVPAAGTEHPVPTGTGPEPGPVPEPDTDPDADAGTEPARSEPIGTGTGADPEPVPNAATGTMPDADTDAPAGTDSDTDAGGDTVPAPVTDIGTGPARPAPAGSGTDPDDDPDGPDGPGPGGAPAPEPVPAPVAAAGTDADPAAGTDRDAGAGTDPEPVPVGAAPHTLYEALANRHRPTVYPTARAEAEALLWDHRGDTAAVRDAWRRSHDGADAPKDLYGYARKWRAAVVAAMLAELRDAGEVRRYWSALNLPTKPDVDQQITDWVEAQGRVTALRPSARQ